MDYDKRERKIVIWLGILSMIVVIACLAISAVGFAFYAFVGTIARISITATP